MKEIFEKELLNLVGVIKSAGVFALDQLPKVCEEMVRYEIWSSLILISISLAVIYLCFKVYRKYIDKCDEELYCAYCFVSFFISSVFVIVLSVQLNGVMKPIFAPRLFILEYLMNLAK